MKKKICIIITIILLGIAVFVGIFLCRDQFSLMINESKIDKEEFLDAASQKKYEVVSHFSGKAGGNVDDGFWEREIEGEIPYELLADAAIEQLKYNRAVYGLAKEKGYIADDSYQGLLERFEAENQARQDKIAKGEAVYGLSEYPLELYREYEMDTFQKRYCEDLENEGMDISDADREQYYEEHKEAYHRENDRILDYIKIPYEEEGLTGEQAEELKQRLTAVYKKMDAENPLAKLAEADEQLVPYLAHADVTAEELRSYSRTISDVLEYAWELKAGESTAVTDEYGCLYLIECTARTENEAASLEEMKDNINKTLREERYDAIIAQRVAEARIEGDMKRIYFFMKKHIDN